MLGVTHQVCVAYARRYREMAKLASTAEALRLYSRLAELWERAASELKPPKANAKMRARGTDLRKKGQQPKSTPLQKRNGL